MAITPPIPATALPVPPSSNDPGNFDTRADTFLSALGPFQTETNALATNVYNNANETLTNATAAASSASAASSSASAASTSAGNANTSASNAASSASSASASASAAQTAKTQAEAARDTALTTGGLLLNATSTTSLSLTAGSKALIIETNKAYAVGQYLLISRTSNPALIMQATVTSYNRATGALGVNVDFVQGSGGPFTDWSVAVIGRTGPASIRSTIIVTANMNAVAGNDYIFDGVYTLTMPTSPNPNDTIGISNGSGGFGPMIDFGSVPVKRRTVGVVTMDSSLDACVLKYTGNSTIGYMEV